MPSSCPTPTAASVSECAFSTFPEKVAAAAEFARLLKPGGRLGIDQIEARLAVVRLTARSQADAFGLDFNRAEPVFAPARQALADGLIGYALLVAKADEKWRGSLERRLGRI